MLQEIDYSVIIRTLGTAGEKYENLLKSISALEPQPKEIIVVLPEGYDLPKEQLGWERFLFSPKGMVSQRVYGIENASTKYALICDDDVGFDSDFVRQLYKPVSEGKCSFSAGPLLSFFPPKGLKTLVSTVMGAASPTLFKKKHYVSLLRTGGYSFNRNIDTKSEAYFEALSLPWTCFFADIEALKRIDIAAEKWLDLNGYSALDDQTMFYKGYLMGYKTLVVSNALYDHLDGRTSVRNNKPATIYASIFNRYVFWHRFIYSQESNVFMKIWARVCINYRVFWCRVFDLIDYLRGRNSKSDLKIIKRAYKDVKKYIKSDDYLNLPAINLQK